MFELVRAISIDVATARAEGRAHVPDAPWLADHFPDARVVPGSVLLELAAQIAGPLCEALGDGGAVLGHVRSVVFRKPVTVPAELVIHAVRSFSHVRVTVGVGDDVAMTGELTFAMIPIDRASASWRAREARVRAWKAAWTSS